MWGIHRWPLNSPHKGPVTRKTFPFHDVIMKCFWGGHARAIMSYNIMWKNNYWGMQTYLKGTILLRWMIIKILAPLYLTLYNPSLVCVKTLMTSIMAFLPEGIVSFPEETPYCERQSMTKTHIWQNWIGPIILSSSKQNNIGEKYLLP